MKIKEIKLPEDFKRFKKLTVSGLPETAKLVVLVGPNGCGKSSLFDAISVKAQSMGVKTPRYLRTAPTRRPTFDPAYYSRDSERPDGDRAVSDIKVTFHGLQESEIEWKKAVYVRSAYRNVPSVEASHFPHMNSALDEPRVAKMIDNDEAGEQNYMRLFSQVLKGALEGEQGNMTLKDFREKTIAEIRNPIESLFSDLTLNKLRDFSAGGETFRFDKGDVKRFAYENLSGGEKAAFDLILDFVVKRQEFNDTVFCIDEPEAHVAVGIQGGLLDVIYQLVPDNCQLWIATHSIGMMRKAYEIYKKDAGKVVFLDFNGCDFDKPQVIEPAEMNHVLWEHMHEVVLDGLANLVFPDALYLCESTPEKSFDAKCYSRIFSSAHPNAKFVSVGSRGEVAKLAAIMRKVAAISAIMQKAAPGQKVFGVVDRDEATEEEAQEAKKVNVRVLSYGCIEDYLLHDNVLTALCSEHGLPPETLDAIKGIREEKKGDPKGAAKCIQRHVIKKHGKLPIGRKREWFLLHLADLVIPKMPIYQELERDIFGDGHM